MNKIGEELQRGRHLKPFNVETKIEGMRLDEIINHENTRYDSTIRTPTPANEPSIFYYSEYVNRNSGTDWNVYLTFHDEGPSDLYWQFSLVPPKDSEIHLVLRGLCESVHSPIVAYMISFDEHGLSKKSQSYFLSPLTYEFQRLTDYMDWNSKIHPPDIILQHV